MNSMGKNDGKKRSEIIHRTKLFGGVTTAEEVHARHGIRQPCAAPGCRNLPVIQIKMFMMHDDFLTKAPDLAAAIAATNPDGPFVPTIPMTFGPMVMFSKVASCRSHQKEAELAASKAPSWVMVEINRGPGADKPQVQVAAAQA